MFELFILMIERLGFIVLIAYILVQSKIFKNILFNRKALDTQILLIIIFTIFAILSNINGVEVQNGQVIYRDLTETLLENSSLANTRALTIGISGIIGGPLVGTTVGVLSSIFRYLQGGLDPQVYVYSSILIGIVSGTIGQKYMKRNQLPEPLVGAGIASGFEIIQMIIILFASSDFTQAFTLVRFIILPMTMINSMGMAIFLSFIHSIQKKQEEDRAIQTHDVLSLANATLPHFRKGLNIESCTEAANEIMNYMHVAAVSITNNEKILAHVGVASDHHKPDTFLRTELSKQALDQGKIVIAENREQIGCHHENCELNAAIVVPLITKSGVVGTLKLYFTDSSELTFVEKNIAAGLGNIFSTQIDLGKSELEAQLLKDAEIKSLQAQVNPHFFFNAVNTISALIRIDSEKARHLLIKLSEFFRANLVGTRSSLIQLNKELEHVEAYLELEQARFPDRYQINFNIDEHLSSMLIPPFTLEIIIENAFKHAFKNRKDGNTIQVTVEEVKDMIHIAVKDNGFGIRPDIIDIIGEKEIVSEKTQGTGSALVNLNKRLLHLYGENSQLTFNSSPTGTTVSCTLPKIQKEVTL